MYEFGKQSVTSVLFDFDGTLSTLRHHWEDVMEPMMLDLIAGHNTVSQTLRDEVRHYIDDSTGIQTIHQMKWLVEAAKRYGLNDRTPTDPWVCKAEYNRRLMELVAVRRQDVVAGRQTADHYLMAGSVALLKALRADGVQCYVASGTDQEDVVEEARVLGVLPYFTSIQGALPGKETCAKETAIRELIDKRGLKGENLAIVGDGKVEITLGNAIGARTLGVASNETLRRGIDPIKQERLIKAEAQKIVGDFTDTADILKWLGLMEG